MSYLSAAHFISKTVLDVASDTIDLRGPGGVDIPDTYWGLYVLCRIRADGTTEGQSYTEVGVRLNDDAGDMYDYIRTQINNVGSSSGKQGTVSQTVNEARIMMAERGPTGSADNRTERRTTAELIIPGYLDTDDKSFMAWGGVGTFSWSGFTWQGYGNYQSDNPVRSIQLVTVPTSGSSDFIAGSQAVLYGLRG